MKNHREAFVNISKQALQRLPLYLNFLKSQRQEGVVNISAPLIAENLHLNDVQVRKDLALVSSGGRPKVGYPLDELIEDLTNFLGYDSTKRAVLVGTGHLGKALLAYTGFKDYGLEIVAAFDNDEQIVGDSVGGMVILSTSEFSKMCLRLNVFMGIIAVPAENAQDVCDRMVECGIRAVWNFSPVHLIVPGNVVVQNENMAASLAVLSKHLDKIVEST